MEEGHKIIHYRSSGSLREVEEWLKETSKNLEKILKSYILAVEKSLKNETKSKTG